MRNPGKGVDYLTYFHLIGAVVFASLMTGFFHSRPEVGEAAIREHAQKGGFLANKISEISAVIDPTTAEG